MRGFCFALAQLAEIDPDNSLRDGYCHRAIRHAVLWAKSELTGSLQRLSVEAIDMPPGACSNPYPASSFKELPLPVLDLAWYMLAEAEIGAGLNEGVADGLYSRLSGGKIPFMEVELRRFRLQAAIESSEPDIFARGLRDYLEAMSFFSAEAAALKENFDPTNPPRGEIPACSLTGAVAEATAADAILAFGMRAAYAARIGRISQLHSALQYTLGLNYPGSTLFSAEQTASADLNHTVMAMLRMLDNPQHLEPRNFWMFGLRFFERNNQCNFGEYLTPLLAEWLRTGWIRVVRDETFRLTLPLRTVPPINAVLANPNNDRAFIAALLLATSDAVAVSLSDAYAERLRAIIAVH